MRKDLKQLARGFEEFQRLPFPNDSDDEEASQLHAELAEYDGFIAGLVSTILGGGRVSAHLLTPDENLRARLEKLRQYGHPAVARAANDYLQRLDALSRLIELAKVFAS